MDVRQKRLNLLKTYCTIKNVGALRFVLGAGRLRNGLRICKFKAIYAHDD